VSELGDGLLESVSGPWLGDSDGYEAAKSAVLKLWPDGTDNPLDQGAFYELGWIIHRGLEVTWRAKIQSMRTPKECIYSY